MIIRSTNRREFAWAFYDWGNSAYATTVMVALFPIFFKEFWHPGTDQQSSTALFVATSISSAIVALSAPVLGAIADKCGGRKKFLAFFTLLGVAATASMTAFPEGMWLAPLFFFLLSLIGFSGGLVYYDALLVSVATKDRWDFVSALGYSVGYLGGGLLFLLNVLMITNPGWFGLADAAQATRLSILSAAAWWGLFAMPLFVLVPEKQPARALAMREAAREGVREFISTFREIRALKPVLVFLLAFYLYNDGVGTVMRTATAFALDLGLESDAIIVALLLTQFVGFPAALAFGIVGQKIGPKTGILICIAVYSLAILYATQMTRSADFFILAGVIGLVQGGVQSLSRSYFARLIPPGKAGEFYGFFNMVGKFAAVAGPMLMTISWFLLPEGMGNYQILSLLLLFGGGAALLWRVRVPEDRQPASA